MRRPQAFHSLGRPPVSPRLDKEVEWLLTAQIEIKVQLARNAPFPDKLKHQPGPLHGRKLSDLGLCRAHADRRWGPPYSRSIAGENFGSNQEISHNHILCTIVNIKHNQGACL